ncbi:MAG: WxcM-like domain-containing protein [Ginsengibacter sp.]
MKATLHKGGSFTDERGSLRFVNEDSAGNYRRFYLITPADTSIIRAWQGHKHEQKAFFAIRGSFTIAVVNPSSFEKPADDEIPEFFELTQDNNDFLRVPGGCYTGIKSKSSDATLLVLSEFDLVESKEDDYRQPANKWVDWNSIN